mmetsp:Transcript_32284/g.77104  ORF Transcript_32284/g.77104 Transcript_32284/m.77104 type:complete len:208 (-) Transcript_32284:916-1539(-)
MSRYRTTLCVRFTTFSVSCSARSTLVRLHSAWRLSSSLPFRFSSSQKPCRPLRALATPSTWSRGNFPRGEAPKLDCGVTPTSLMGSRTEESKRFCICRSRRITLACSSLANVTLATSCFTWASLERKAAMLEASAESVVSRRSGLTSFFDTSAPELCSASSSLSKRLCCSASSSRKLRSSRVARKTLLLDCFSTFHSARTRLSKPSR